MTDVLFPYALDDDNEVFGQIELNLGKTKIYQIKISAYTTAGRRYIDSPKKPNEDAFSIIKLKDSITAAVFDGTSSLKPIKSLGEQTGARFASHFLKSQLEGNVRVTTTKEIIRELSKLLLARSLQFEGSTLENTHTLPASTATIIKLDLEKEIIELSHVGDSYCVVFYKDGNSKLITVNKNRDYDNKIFELMKKVAQEKHITSREARQDEKVKHALIDKYQDSHNRPDGTGQGLINGDPNVEQYIQDTSIPLKSVNAVLLASDGLIPLDLDEQNSEDRSKLLEIIQEDGLKEVVRMKCKVENNDPNWNLIRYKHSDDATGIFISFN